jgi:hypothetical protein
MGIGVDQTQNPAERNLTPYNSNFIIQNYNIYITVPKYIFAELAQNNSNEKKHKKIDWQDIYRYDNCSDSVLLLRIFDQGRQGIGKIGQNGKRKGIKTGGPGLGYLFNRYGSKNWPS